MRAAASRSPFSWGSSVWLSGSVWAATIRGTVGNDTLGVLVPTLSGKGGNDRLFGPAATMFWSAGRAMTFSWAGAARTRFAAGRVATPRPATSGTRSPGTARWSAARSQPCRRHPPRLHRRRHPLLPRPAPPRTTSFGPEVTPTQQAAARDALDMAARYYRTALGREVPPFSVWGFGDIEALARLYLERSGEVTSARTVPSAMGSPGRARRQQRPVDRAALVRDRHGERHEDPRQGGAHAPCSRESQRPRIR